MEKQSFELSFSITVSGLSGAMGTMRGTMKAEDICPMRLLFLWGINFESLYTDKLYHTGSVLVTFLITTTKYLAKAPSGRKALVQLSVWGCVCSTIAVEA